MAFLKDTIDFVNFVKTLPRLREEEGNRYPFDQSNACTQLDAHIRDLDVRITEEAKKTLQGDEFDRKRASAIMNSVLKPVRDEKQALFNKMNCANELEKKKMLETAQIISDETKKYDTDVSKQTKESQTLLMVIGGAVLVIAFSLLLFKSKKKKP